MVRAENFEISFSDWQPDVLSFVTTLAKMVKMEGFEPPAPIDGMKASDSKSDRFNQTRAHLELKMVEAARIERASLVLQTSALTNFATLPDKMLTLKNKCQQYLKMVQAAGFEPAVDFISPD